MISTDRINDLYIQSYKIQLKQYYITKMEYIVIYK